MKPVFYIVRHGTAGDDDNYNSPVDSEIKPEGIREAQRLARYFADKGIGYIDSANLDRAKSTAHIIGSYLGIKPRITDSLDSLNVGNAKNMKSAEEADALVEYHDKHPDVPIPGGESLNNLRDRIVPNFKEAEKRDKPTVIVAHHSTQYEAGKHYNQDKHSAVTPPGGIAVVYQTPNGLRAKAVDTGNDMKRKHPFSHTVTEHHKDGTHTVHHIHEKHNFQHTTPEREGDVKGAAADHDGMMDHMMEHTSAPNPGEGKDEANQPLPGAGGAAATTPPPAAGAPPAGV